MKRIAHVISQCSRSMLVGMAVLIAGGALADSASAQRPFRVHDPFYRGETARRTFFDGYAFTTEVAYRSSGSVQDGQQSFAQDFLGLSFRLDYQISPHIDVGAILDASGSNTGRTIGLSWLTFKYYETQENTDYAFRLAIDPALDSRLGSPQLDIALLTTTLLSPTLSSDYALGFRRVRVGYEQLVPVEPQTPPSFPEPVQRTEIINTRAFGWEVHAMSQYSVILNPARNNIFASAQLYVGKYEIFETALRRTVTGVPDRADFGDETTDAEADSERDIKRERFGGAFWIRSGVEYNRPSFQLMPFLNVALKRWMSSDAEASPRLSVGLRFTLR